MVFSRGGPRSRTRAAVVWCVCGVSSWSYADQEAWPKQCESRQQSPINIVDDYVTDAESTSLQVLYKPWNQTGAVTTFDGVPVIAFPLETEFGRIQVGTGFDDFDEYVLSWIEIHSPSEHSFRSAQSWPVEIQLVHEPALRSNLGPIDEFVAQSKQDAQRVLEVEKELDTVVQRLRKHQTEAESDSAKTGQLREQLEEDRKEFVRLAAKTTVRSNTLYDRVNELRHMSAQIETRQRRQTANDLVVISIFLQRGYFATPTASKFSAWLNAQLAMKVGKTPPKVSHNVEPVSDEEEATDEQPQFRSEELFMRGLGNVVDAFHYTGSLTHPPCTPGVKWFLGTTAVEIMSSDLDALQAMVQEVAGMKSGEAMSLRRELQEVDNRTVERVPMDLGAFREANVGVSSQSMAHLRWEYVRLYCTVFLVCSVLMVCTAMFLCATRLCGLEQEWMEDSKDQTLMSPADENGAWKPDEQD
mmetsp:Transcript_97497/g.260196  ORF Transcript_97497/g.260196 Transcript_97497/m.260196 type:complete len:471 (+) Transcript_97497:2-1414(+)